MHVDVLVAVRRVVLLEVAEEHVLQAVGDVEDADHRAALDLLQRVEEHRLALGMHQVGLVEERLLVQHALVQPPGVLGQPERRVAPQQLGQVDRVGEGVRDRQRRLVGVDVDRRHVQPEVRRGLEQVEAHDAAHADTQPGLELQLDPGRELPRLQRVALLGDRQLRARVALAEPHFERNAHLAGSVYHRVLGPGDVAANHAVAHFDRDAHAAGEGALARRLVAVVREGALAALEVRHAHRRQQRAVELLGREGDRHAQDRAEDAVVAEDLPERLALATQVDHRLTQGDLVLADLQGAPRSGHLGRAQLRQVRLAVGHEEVEDLVLARIAAGLEAGPGDR